MIDMSTKKTLIICAVALLISVALEFALAEQKSYFWWHGVIGFNVLFGFLGCVAIIAVAGLIGKAFLQRKENYYGNDSDEGGGDNA